MCFNFACLKMSHFIRHEVHACVHHLRVRAGPAYDDDGADAEPVTELCVMEDGEGGELLQLEVFVCLFY